MSEKEGEEIDQNWVVCNPEPVTKEEEDVNRGVAVQKKKKRGYRIWRYLGWGSSSSAATTPPPPPALMSEEEEPTATIHDAEMFESLQNAGASSPPATPRNSVEDLTGPENKVELDKVFPVDTLETRDQVYSYLDQIIESLNATSIAEIPKIAMPELPILAESEEIDFRPPVPISTDETDEHDEANEVDEHDDHDVAYDTRQEEAELIAYFEQLARELATTSDDDDMPSLLSASLSSFESDTDEVFGNEPLIDSKDDFGWSDVNVDDYLKSTSFNEIVIEIPQSPRLRRRRRPATPYAKRRRYSSDEEVSSEMKRCKMSASEEEDSSDTLSQMERGQLQNSSPDATVQNKFHALLDKLCDEESESDDEAESVLQVICSEFTELAESITDIFRRGCQ